MDDDSVHQHQRTEKNSHSVERGDFSWAFIADGFAMQRHPAASASGEIGSVMAVAGKVPINKKIQREPAHKGQNALTQAHRDGDCRAQCAGPDKDLHDILNHN